jgi:hypothetical protein
MLPLFVARRETPHTNMDPCSWSSTDRAAIALLRTQLGARRATELERALLAITEWNDLGRKEGHR